MSHEAFKRAADVAAIRYECPPAGRMLSQEEVAALFAAAAEGNAPAGDSALVAVAYCAGLRRFELSALDLADLDAKTGKLTLRVAKGNKSRIVFLPPNALARVRAWIEERGDWAGPLFNSMNKSGKPQRTRLSSDGVEHVLKALGAHAAIAHFSVHDLLRTMISEMLDRCVDLITVQKLAGHQRPATTSRYDRRGDDRKRKAASLLDVPA